MSLQQRIGERERQYALEVLEGQFRKSDSAAGTRLEQVFADTIGVRFAIGFVNGTATLHSALAAMGVGAGDEVICPSVDHGLHLHGGGPPPGLSGFCRRGFRNLEPRSPVGGSLHRPQDQGHPAGGALRASAGYAGSHADRRTARASGAGRRCPVFPGIHPFKTSYFDEERARRQAEALNGAIRFFDGKG